MKAAWPTESKYLTPKLLIAGPAGRGWFISNRLKIRFLIQIYRFDGLNSLFLTVYNLNGYMHLVNQGLIKDLFHNNLLNVTRIVFLIVGHLLFVTVF